MEEVLLESANAAANTVATELFVRLTKNALQLTGDSIGQHVQSTDGPGLFSPLDVVRDGKDRLGAILALGDRAIIAWTVGGLRIKNFEFVIPYSGIESIDATTRPGGMMSKDREMLKIEADDQTWELVFANVFEGGRSIVPYLKGVLEGSIKPVFTSE